MLAYRPAGIPIWKKILTSPFLHVGIVFALVFTSIMYVRQKQREELRARVEYLKGGPLLVERSQKDSGQVQVEATPQAQDQIAVQQAEEANSPAADVVPAGQTESSSALATAETAAPISTAKAAVAEPAPAPVRAGPSRAIVIYAEIESATLNAWMEEMRATNQLRTFDDVMMGPLPQVSQKLKSSRGIKILQRVEHPISQLPSTVDWFSGTHRGVDLDSEVGFFGSLALSDSKDGLIRGEVEVQRAFRNMQDAAKSMERVSFGGPFELGPSAGFMMRNLLPRNKYTTDFGEELNPDAFLTIFKSQAFREGQTEFTLILEFDNTSPQAR